MRLALAVMESKYGKHGAQASIARNVPAGKPRHDAVPECWNPNRASENSREAPGQSRGGATNEP
jgi:hypothetical protein